MASTTNRTVIYLVWRSSSQRKRNGLIPFVSFRQGGLGQLSDGKTGPDNREDIDGLQWVSGSECSFLLHSKSEHGFRSDGVNRAERD